MQTAHQPPGRGLRAHGFLLAPVVCTRRSHLPQEEGHGDRPRGVHLPSHDPPFLGAGPSDSCLHLLGQKGFACHRQLQEAGGRGALAGWFLMVSDGCLATLTGAGKEGVLRLATGRQLRCLPGQPRNKQSPNPDQAHLGTLVAGRLSFENYTEGISGRPKQLLCFMTFLYREIRGWE